MKGLILAGGKGTRLLPATKTINKHMIPLLNVPMIVYPLNTLISLGIKDIMIVSGGNDVGDIIEFLDDGAEYGVNLTYRVQKEAGGIAQALGLAKDFVGNDTVAVILGDNIFDNSQIKIPEDLQPNEACIFGATDVKDMHRFGVLFQEGTNGKRWIIEKPETLTQYCRVITGLYIYPSDVFEIVTQLKPSARGELEISSVNMSYLEDNRLKDVVFTGFWKDAGTPKSLKEAIGWVSRDLE